MVKADIDLNQMRTAIDAANELIEKLKEARELANSLTSLTSQCLQLNISEKQADD